MFLIGSDGRIGNLSVVSVCAGLPLAEVAEALTPILHSPERFDVSTEIHANAEK